MNSKELINMFPGCNDHMNGMKTHLKGCFSGNRLRDTQGTTRLVVCAMQPVRGHQLLAGEDV